jgi:carbon storage regulator
MLVLSRKQSQRIQIGEDVVVTVVRIEGNTVRIGIEAPAHMPVLREELLLSAPRSISTRQLAKPVYADFA